MEKGIVISSHNTGLALIRGLGREGVPVTVLYYDPNDMGYVSKFVERRVRIPNPEENEEEFVQYILDMKTEYQGGILFPADDASLFSISKNKKIFEDAGYIASCPDFQVTEKYLNKIYTYEGAASAGIPFPRTDLVKKTEDVERILPEIEYPCLVKPCVSHRYAGVFGKKLKKVFDAGTLLRACNEALENGLEVMVQEFIPGDHTNGVNYNSYIWNGEVLLDQTASKVRLTDDGFGVPCVVVNREVEEVRKLGPPVLKSLGFEGYSCTEFKLDPRDGKYKLLEINGRYNRSGLQPLSTGVNFPWFMYSHLTGRPLPEFTIARGTIYWIDEFGDLVSWMPKVLSGKLSFREFLRPYRSKHIFAVFDRKDLHPFFKRLRIVAKKGLLRGSSKIFRRTKKKGISDEK